jgi:hypothetical protein
MHVSEGGVGKHSLAVRLAPTLLVSKRNDEKPTGKDTPASIPCTMGQRLHPMILIIPEDDRGWLLNLTSLKDVSGQPDLPSDQSGFRKERLGLIKVVT